MNSQKVVDGIGAMTCVVSVERLENGGYGEIRIVTGNKAYIDSIERPMNNVQMLVSRFTPNSLYTDYMTRDLNFEDFCYRAAVEKKCLHSYAHPDRFDVWFNMTFLPLTPDEGNLCFCTYTMEINPVADSSRLSNVSSDLASALLETAIKLRGARDFEAAMADVIKDIRELCHAKQCCVLLMEPVSRTCSTLLIAGEHISISMDYILGWEPIGREMEVTLDPRAAEIGETTICLIDGKPALEVYRKYLGVEWNDNFIMNVCEFPLMVQQNGVKICLVPMDSHDGGLTLIGNVEQIKNHPVMGARILTTIREKPKLVTGARWHHERFDGRGYPDGLMGPDIPEEARIIAVADAYDAMTSNRSYRRGIKQGQVRQQIEKGKGSQFDPKYADIMITIIDEDKDYRMREM